MCRPETVVRRAVSQTNDEWEGRKLWSALALASSRHADQASAIQTARNVTSFRHRNATCSEAEFLIWESYVVGRELVSPSQANAVASRAMALIRLFTSPTPDGENSATSINRSTNKKTPEAIPSDATRVRSDEER